MTLLVTPAILGGGKWLHGGGKWLHFKACITGTLADVS